VVFFENSRFRYKNYFFFKIQTFIESKLKWVFLYLCLKSSIWSVFEELFIFFCRWRRFSSFAHLYPVNRLTNSKVPCNAWHATNRIQGQ
jgi:hypothetical protein